MLVAMIQRIVGRGRGISIELGDAQNPHTSLGGGCRSCNLARENPVVARVARVENNHQLISDWTVCYFLHHD